MKGSFRVVTQGLELAFKSLGVLDGVFFGETTDFDDELVGGAQSPIAVVTGDPMRVLQTHFHGQHKNQWLMLAPNSEGIPPSFVRQLKDMVKLPGGEKVPTLTGFLAPSRWAEGVLQREFPDHPVILCPHGVLPVFQVHEGSKRGDAFRLLHVSSSRLSRKGTVELVAAWKLLQKSRELPEGSTLRILVNPAFFDEFLGFVSEGIEVYHGQNILPEVYARGLQNFNFVVQPSRAEGFGLVPLEARACGVPVIATGCTGHATHMQGPGVVLVKHRDNALSDDYLGASAPTVRVEDVLKALEYGFDNRKGLQEEAKKYAGEIQQSWSWERRVAPAVLQMKEHLDGNRGRIGLDETLDL